MGVVLPQSGRGFKFFARNCTIGTPLQEILDPPLSTMIATSNNNDGILQRNEDKINSQVAI